MALINIHKGMITIKWTNSNKGFNYKWVFFEHFDFFIKKNFDGFFSNMFLEILTSPTINWMC
jgi:spore maturation protein CgeB